MRLFTRESIALFYSLRHRGTPMSAKVAAILSLVYAVSPFDIVPDFIPLAGWLDDLLIVPIGLSIARKLIPTPVMEDARLRADRARTGLSVVAGVVIGLLIVLAIVIVWSVVKR
jgi:uncharacterized membrane protein YkvA (DUF1232 family)